jgi:ketosteroid isomerase-like protein
MYIVEDIVDTGENNGEVLEQYKAICDYDGSQADGQVAFPEGAIVTVIEKDEDGQIKLPHDYQSY